MDGVTLLHIVLSPTLIESNTDLWLNDIDEDGQNVDVADLPDWLQEGVPNLKCLCSRVIRRYRLPYDDGAILPVRLIPFVSLH